MATAASIPERPRRDVEQPLLSPSKAASRSAGEDGSPSVGDSGLEREQIELDICRLLAEAKPEAYILVVATIALFITAGTQLLIPWVTCGNCFHQRGAGTLPPSPTAGQFLGTSSTQ